MLIRLAIALTLGAALADSSLLGADLLVRAAAPSGSDTLALQSTTRSAAHQGGARLEPHDARTRLVSRRALRIVTYEFLEGMKGGSELGCQQILAAIDQLGGADVLLCKGFQYYKGNFDDSSGGYPRFRAKIDQLIPLAHKRNIALGVFGFTQRGKTYKDQEDYQKVLDVWAHYVRQGADLLMVDEESGRGGLDIPKECLEYCDDLRARFKLPVGLFIYGPASEGVPVVSQAAAHVDILADMSYSLFLDKPGEYNLAHVTRLWSEAAKRINPNIAYWTGAGVFGEDHFPGLPGTAMWQQRYGNRDESQYFHDYLKTAIDNGATGVFYHSLCRTTWWKEDRQKRIVAGVSAIFAELTKQSTSPKE